MTKDKLAALIAAQDDSEPEDAYDFPDNDPMEAFFNEIQTIREMLNNIEECVEEVKKLHSTLLTAPQTDPKDKQRLEDLQAEIKRNANQARSKLTQIQPEDDGDKSSAETRMRMTQHMTLSKKMVEIMTEYNRAQVDFSDRCKSKLQRQLEIAGKQTTPEEFDKMLEEGNVSVFTDDIITDTRQAKQNLADIETRHADLIKLEKSIKELHDMFLDMAVLVETQGELLDRIEYQVGLTRDRVDDATKDLKKASSLQKAARKKKLMILLCLTISGIIVISIIAANLP